MPLRRRCKHSQLFRWLGAGGWAHNSHRLVKLPSVGGMVPVIWLLFKYLTTSE